MKFKKGFYWHIHHNKLMEWCWDEGERISAIRKKPANEIETRLRLFKLVRGRLPKELVEAGEAYYKAREAYYKAGEAYNKAKKAYYKAREAYKPELEKLHAEECSCKEWNGEAIVFPEVKL